MMTLEEFGSRLRDSAEIVCFTGAGISTESGIPDFRSPGGIWTKYLPVTFEEYLRSEEARLATWRRRLEMQDIYRSAKPNVGHYFISALDKRGKLLGLITQNTDGLHGEAGLSQEKIVELHGTNRKIVCLTCSRAFDPGEILRKLAGDFKSPTCDACGGILKSATVSFGQAMPVEAMRRAQDLTVKARVFIVLGSSLVVYPAASFPLIAKRSGALLAIINREPTPLDELADFLHHGEIGDFCRKLGAIIADG